MYIKHRLSLLNLKLLHWILSKVVLYVSAVHTCAYGTLSRFTVYGILYYTISSIWYAYLLLSPLHHKMHTCITWNVTLCSTLNPTKSVLYCVEVLYHITWHNTMLHVLNLKYVIVKRWESNAFRRTGPFNILGLSVILDRQEAISLRWKKYFDSKNGMRIFMMSQVVNHNIIGTELKRAISGSIWRIKNLKKLRCYLEVIFSLRRHPRASYTMNYLRVYQAILAKTGSSKNSIIFVTVFSCTFITENLRIIW